MIANDNQAEQKMENDFEVALHYPDKDNYFSGGRTLLKEDLSLEGAAAYAREYISSQPETDCDLWITRSPSGQGVQFIKPMFLGNRAA
jgi:hypothetical protein